MAEHNFEKALTELENIVEKLEGGGVNLNESLTLFEKGVKLVKFLREELDKAEKKIEILLKDEKGEVHAEPFELSQEKDSTPEEKEEPDSGENNDLPF